MNWLNPVEIHPNQLPGASCPPPSLCSFAGAAPGKPWGFSQLWISSTGPEQTSGEEVYIKFICLWVYGSKGETPSTLLFSSELDGHPPWFHRYFSICPYWFYIPPMDFVTRGPQPIDPIHSTKVSAKVGLLLWPNFPSHACPIVQYIKK